MLKTMLKQYSLAYRMKRLARAILAVHLVFLTTGCWDRIEINDLAIVLATAIDQEPNGLVRVSALIPLPGNISSITGGGGGSGGSQSYYVDSEVGRTIREATSKLQLRTERRFSFSHRRILIVGEELAKESGIQSLFETLPRLHDTRLTTHMVIAKGKGYDLLNATPHFERFSSEVIRELSQSPESLHIEMKHIAAALKEEGVDPVIPYMAPKKTEKGLDKKEEVENLGIALFQGDKMVGAAGPKEMFGISWLHEKVANYVDTVEVESGQYVTYKITEGKSHIQPVIQDRHVLFKIDIRGYAMIQEKQSDFDMRDQQAFLDAEKAMNKQIQASVQTVIHRIQKQKIDPAALGQKLWFAYPQQWESSYQPNWRNELANTQFDVKVDVHFYNYGLIYDNIANGGD